MRHLARKPRKPIRCGACRQWIERPWPRQQWCSMACKRRAGRAREQQRRRDIVLYPPPPID
jgi:hypothetical protein